MFLRSLHFAFVFVLLALSGTLACFRVDHYETAYVLAGTGYSKDCQCEEDGFTIKDLTWLGPDEKEIGLSGPGSASTQEVDTSLNMDITSLSKSMSGIYKCITNFNGRQYSKNYELHVYDPLVFTNAEKDQYLIESTDSMLYCEVSADAPPMFTWYRIEDDGLEFQLNNNEKYQIMAQGLLIRNVTTDDSGTFKCRVSVMSTGEDVYRSIAVKVMTAPKIFRVNAIPRESITEGDKLILECIADSTPFPEYSWNKTSEMTPSANKTWSPVENSIVFNEVQASDSGIYECYAHNTVGGVKKEIVIEVLVPPTIYNFTNVTAVENEELEIRCIASGHPAPNVTILFYGKGLQQDEVDEGIVEIVQNQGPTPVSRAAEGYYVCNASNEVGFVTEEMYLTVNHKPFFDQSHETIWGWEGQTVKLSCNHESNPEATIQWSYQNNDIPSSSQAELNTLLIEKMNANQELNEVLTISNNSSYYGIYSCTAKNDYGEATKDIHLKEMFPPLPVANAYVKELTATSVTFSIYGQVDEDKNLRITGFTAEYDTAENYLVTNIHKNRTWSIDRPFKLDNLKPNTAYKVSFVAINEVGPGKKNGELLEFHTLNKTVPELPVWEWDGLEVYLNDTTLLRWTEPENNGAPIDYYILRYCPAHDETQCKEIQTAQTKVQFELGDLDENTTYYLAVVAHNSEGDSLPANATVKTLALTATEAHVFLSGGVLIGISIVIVIIFILLLDLLLFFWKRQGIIAACCLKKKKTKDADCLQARDKKGLLRDNGESCDALRPANGHKEFEYNKNTGVITGKHSAV